ncbi:hypothetical protein NL108_012698 [Boleophthalmus pectinirostris]|uniref:cytochrome c oxidase assembly factor 1 homolog n=1 Tax=Boleophthalmus pectinirostris TaxID=150288 RepID=UPI000A1C27AC|nr:cytochrome c oxidase assembly factor 1 homolog [Boleophthalmus pectinirostris]KAJ0059281.1 hypothetical protein NL108_012698 [Boleophthalmus pectinirostris]
MRISTKKLQELAIFTTVVTGGGVGVMYYLMQKKFAASEYHQLAVQKLEACSVAMESLGAPPLKVYNLRLTDKQNYIDQHWAQIKIPVKGSKTGGYLYTSSHRDERENRWRLKQAVLKLREGDTIDLLNPPRTETVTTQEVLDTGEWE